MRKLLNLTIALILLFSSCGLFKKTTIDKSKLEVKTKTEISAHVDSQGTKNDKTIIVEKQNLDTVINTKGTNFNTEKKVNYADLLKGLNIVDSGLVKIHVKYDSLSKSLKTSVIVRPEAIPVRFEKTKTTYTDVTETSNKTSNTNTKNEAVLTEEKKLKVKEPAKMGVWLVAWIVVVLALIAVAWWFVKKFKIF